MCLLLQNLLAGGAELRPHQASRAAHRRQRPLHRRVAVEQLLLLALHGTARETTRVRAVLSSFHPRGRAAHLHAHTHADARGANARPRARAQGRGLTCVTAGSNCEPEAVARS
jgi:hypothetical protein